MLSFNCILVQVLLAETKKGHFRSAVGNGMEKLITVHVSFSAEKYMSYWLTAETSCGWHTRFLSSVIVVYQFMHLYVPIHILLCLSFSCCVVETDCQQLQTLSSLHKSYVISQMMNRMMMVPTGWPGIYLYVA